MQATSQYRIDSHRIYNSEFNPRSGNVFVNKVEALVVRADQIASKALGRGDDAAPQQEERGLGSRVLGGVNVGDINVGNSYGGWGNTTVYADRRGRKDNSGVAILAGIATLALAGYAANLYRKFEESRKAINEFQGQFQNWFNDVQDHFNPVPNNRNVRRLPENEDEYIIRQLFNNTKSLLNEKYASACWNLALTVTVATSTFFLAAGAIMAAEGLMVVSGLAILTSATVCVIRIGYRWGDTSEVDNANKIMGDSKILRETRFPMLLQRNEWVRLSEGYEDQVKGEDDCREQYQQYPQPYFVPQPQNQQYAYPGYPNQQYQRN